MVWFSVVVQVRATPGGVGANVCCFPPSLMVRFNG